MKMHLLSQNVMSCNTLFEINLDILSRRSMSNRDLRQDVDYTIYRKRRDSRNCRNNGGGLVGGGGGYGNLRKYQNF